MPDIKQITLPSGTTYDLRDSRVDSIISQGTRWVGVTTTQISDGSTTSTIVIGGVDHNAEIGDIAGYQETGKQQEEFIWSGTMWQEFGSTGSLKALAFKDTASGTVAVPATYAFSGSSTSVSVSGTTAGSVSETKGTVTVSPASSGTATYTPSGSVSGTVGTPTISVKTAGSTASVTPFGSAGSLPSCTLPTYTVANEILTITAGSFSAGTLPSGGTAVTVKTGDAAYEASTPSFSGSFSGTGVRLATDSQVLTGASFSGASMTSTGSVTATGSVTTATTENKTVTVS